MSTNQQGTLSREDYIAAIEGLCHLRKSVQIVPHDNDVLCGKGKSIDHHPGNLLFRSIVNNYKHDYVSSPLPDKHIYAKMVLDAISSLEPPGRFLTKVTNDTGVEKWTEVTKERAVRKARQALREGAPEIRKKTLSHDVVRQHQLSKRQSS